MNMFMGWNWVGILLWIVAICFFVWIIHFIRVKQLMLIISTHKSFDKRLFVKYVGLLILSFLFIGVMSWLSFFRPVDMTKQTDVDITTKYNRLELKQVKDSYYYVTAQKSKNGAQPIVSYTYLSEGSETTISSRNGTISRGTDPVNIDASVYPWNKEKLTEFDAQTAHAFSAEMTIKYKKTFLNGLGVRSGHAVGYYTLIRVPSADFIYSKTSK